jgi:hypothetical protein
MVSSASGSDPKVFTFAALLLGNASALFAADIIELLVSTVSNDQIIHHISPTADFRPRQINCEKRDYECHQLRVKKLHLRERSLLNGLLVYIDIA